MGTLKLPQDGYCVFETANVNINILDKVVVGRLSKLLLHKNAVIPNTQNKGKVMTLLKVDLKCRPLFSQLG